MITLAVDMSSGDLGSKAALEGVRLFQEKHPNEVNFLLVGKREELEGAQSEIVDAKEVMPMEAGVLDALRNKESSMFKAVNSVKEKKADGVISCGGTGAFLTCATVLLRKIPGAERACLVAPFPTRIKGKRVVILDVGANNENSGKEIAQFAFMGSLYSKCVYGTKDPKVYVLSNGSEEGKGSPEGQEAYALLKERKDINFQGNLEARDVLNGDADVVATDGFSGNTLLKGTEGVAKMMSVMMKSAFQRNIFSKLGYLLSRKGFKDMKETMDYKSVGGAMLLGVNGVVVKAHGNSDGVAIFHAIEVAYSLVKNKLVDQIKEGLSQ